MSKRQRLVIMVGAFIVSTMLLVPPYNKRSSGRPAGYGLLFAPDKRFSFEFDRIQVVGIKRQSGGSVRVDTTTLTIQCLIVCILAGSAATGLRPPKESRTKVRPLNKDPNNANNDGPQIYSFSPEIKHSEARSRNRRARLAEGGTPEVPPLPPTKKLHRAESETEHAKLEEASLAFDRLSAAFRAVAVRKDAESKGE